MAHLFAGIALLTLSRRWRIAALVALAMAAAAGMLIAIMMAVAPEHAAVTIPGSDFGIPVVQRPRWAAAAAVVVAVMLLWPAYTLLSRKARALFNQTASK